MPYDQIPPDPYKVYVEVTAIFSPEGKITPVSFRWEDGRVYEIDRVLDVRPRAATKAGGCGMRYLCMVRGRETRLFLEGDRWFMERK